VRDAYYSKRMCACGRKGGNHIPPDFGRAIRAKMLSSTAD
jgi:hypothetical protein